METIKTLKDILRWEKKEVEGGEAKLMLVQDMLNRYNNKPGSDRWNKAMSKKYR